MVGEVSSLITGSCSRPGTIPGPTCSSVLVDRKMYGNVTSFNILMQNFYKLQQVRMGRVSAFITWLEGC